mmetsp:Transcript_73029/g.136412  ORF Transcript_73029/g.136412 Transcript_73029/m.136412 type:complete len:220 (-) Transcript_73029:75-734(-)
MLQSVAELTACACYVATFAVVVFGIFGNVQGGGQDSASWFPWHPVLMSLSFPCLMGLGRMANVTTVELSRDSRRMWHGIVMICAVAAAIFGYLCIFMAHWPKKKFFGYDFENQAWDPHWTRIAHAWCGYSILIASLVQGVFGPLKMRALSTGQRMYTWHGKLGKLIMLGVIVVLCLAVNFWTWAMPLKIVLYVLVIASGALGAFLPRAEDPESLPLASS